jgi:VIT1/CCC1 family predicted Fe2+/Mn2+ transporter
LRAPDGTGREEERRGSLDREHTPEAIRARLSESPSPSLVKDAILGATDGCVTTFAVVAGAIGGSLSGKVVLILGFANLIADGFSMAASNYLSSKALNEEVAGAEARERKHIRLVPEGETEEVRQIFAAKGFSGDLLERIVQVIVGDTGLWIRTMLVEELGLRPGDAKPVRAALATFTAFCLAGLVPLVAYLVPGLPGPARFAGSCASTAAAFFGIGFWKGRLLTGTGLRPALGTLALGGTAAALAFLTGWLLGHLSGAG